MKNDFGEMFSHVVDVLRLLSKTLLQFLFNLMLLFEFHIF